MKIEVLHNKGNELNFVLKDSNPALANTLRRLIVSEVPTLAIEDINFLKNDSALYDEMVAHRLGLIPLKTDLKSYELKETCSCKGEGCVKCQVNIKLSSKGPCIVYSSELHCEDSKIKPVYDNLPITKLINNQKLEFEAIAIMGNGKQHNKFSPAFVHYKAVPIIEINDKCKLSGKCVEQCPKDILSIENNKLKIKNLYDCHLCKACEDVCPNGAIKVTKNDKDFIFYMESHGQLTPKEILEEAIRIFDNKLDELTKHLKISKADTVVSAIKKKIKREK